MTPTLPGHWLLCGGCASRGGADGGGGPANRRLLQWSRGELCPQTSLEMSLPVCVCVSLCVYVGLCVCLCVSLCICVPVVCEYVCVCVSVCVPVSVCMCVSVSVCVFLCTSVCECVHVYPGVPHRGSLTGGPSQQSSMEMRPPGCPRGLPWTLGGDAL